MAFPFVAGIVDCATRYLQFASMTRVHEKYTVLVNRLTKDCNQKEVRLNILFDVKGEIQRLAEMMKKSFDEHFVTGLYTAKVYFLDCIVENLKTLGSLDLLNSSSFARYNVHIKSVRRFSS